MTVTLKPPVAAADRNKPLQPDAGPAQSHPTTRGQRASIPRGKLQERGAHLSGYPFPRRRAGHAHMLRAKALKLTSGLAHVENQDLHVVGRVRAQLVHIHALPANQLPTAEQVREALGDDRLQHYAQLLCGIHGSHRDALLPTQLPRPQISLAALLDSPDVLDSALHDAYFAVVRAAPDDMMSHVEAIVLAAHVLRREMRTGSDVMKLQDFREMARGVETAFTLATGLTTKPIKLMRRVAEAHQAEAMIARRWLRGHQLFLVITQAMIASVNRLDALTAAGADPVQVTDGIEALVVLLRAAAAAMRLTGDFSPAIYDTLIRPSMSPPVLPDGFSGIFSSDHRFLVTRLRDMGPTLTAFGRQFDDAHTALVQSFSALYDDHINVCGRFVASDKNSLLMTDGARCTALDQLAKFKKSRIRLIAKS